MLRNWILVSLLLSFGFTGTQAETGNYSNRSDVTEFVAEMAQEGFDRQQLLNLFSDARYQQSVIDAISRPAERRLTWNKYQDIFLTKSRVKKGRLFMLDHQRVLAAAETKYGVPATIICSIIGVETMYGQIMGKYRVIDSLSTLAFDYPPRATFFRAELKHFLRLAREEGRNASTPMGSYAGAMGYGQFISSSYRAYAVDFDGDGIRDIWNNPADAIGSVANYLARHGWKTGAMVTVRATLNTKEPANAPKLEIDKVFNVSLKPNITVAEMAHLGVSSQQRIASDTAVSPMMLDGKKGKEYWLGLQNFYVITRYNHSKLYAMAVFQLSEKLGQQMISLNEI